MELAYMNHKATSLLRDVAEEFETEASKMAISGCVGPREDAYLPNGSMTPEQAGNIIRHRSTPLLRPGST
jgi:methionine synthase I (cobalamin-dependent)